MKWKLPLINWLRDVINSAKNRISNFYLSQPQVENILTITQDMSQVIFATYVIDTINKSEVVWSKLIIGFLLLLPSGLPAISSVLELNHDAGSSRSLLCGDVN